MVQNKIFPKSPNFSQTQFAYKLKPLIFCFWSSFHSDCWRSCVYDYSLSAQDICIKTALQSSGASAGLNVSFLISFFFTDICICSYWCSITLIVIYAQSKQSLFWTLIVDTWEHDGLNLYVFIAMGTGCLWTVVNLNSWSLDDRGSWSSLLFDHIAIGLHLCPWMLKKVEVTEQMIVGLKSLGPYCALKYCFI